MAVSCENSAKNFMMCSICYELFKNPRYLPCLHTFCCACLDSYIVSSVKQAEKLDGFRCPLCRLFIPPPECDEDDLKIEEWAKKFPLNKFIASVLERDLNSSLSLCDACKNVDEESSAINWCKECLESLCIDCTKSHKKFRALRSHEIIPVTDISKCIVPSSSIDQCDIHNKTLEMFCADHQTLNCVSCFMNSHRGCGNINTVENTASELHKNKTVDVMLTNMKKFNDAIDAAITDQKKNIADIDTQCDNISHDISKFREEVFLYLEKLQDEQLAEIANISKESRAKLQTSVDAFEAKKSYVEFCKQLLQQAEECQSDTNLVHQFVKVREIFYGIPKAELQKVKINIQFSRSEEMDEVKNIKKFVELDKLEENLKIFSDLSLDGPELVTEFSLPEDVSVYGGIFIPGGRILFADCNSSKCLIYSEDGTFLQNVEMKGNPWDAVQKSSKLYVSLDTQRIQKISLFDMKPGCSINIKEKCRGLAKSDEDFVMACDKSIILVDSEFNEINTIPTVNSGSDDVVADKQGNIIYSSCITGIVTKMDKEGNVLFRYQHPGLHSPYGLALDRDENLYVPDNYSSSVHVISPEGTLIRIIEAVVNPNCIKFKEFSSKCFIVHCINDTNVVKIYDFTVNK